MRNKSLSDSQNASGALATTVNEHELHKASGLSVSQVASDTLETAPHYCQKPGVSVQMGRAFRRLNRLGFCHFEVVPTPEMGDRVLS